MFCAKVKEFLSQNKIDFIEKDVASGETALQELEKLGYMTTPVTVVYGAPASPATGAADANKDVVVGFDPDKLRELLKIG